MCIRDSHEAWLPDVMTLALPGAFAMTEIGHGSDVASIGTTATYDTETEEFVIHTPFKGAWKEFLGNAALHGQAAVVFAQLITRGVNHGVHAFFVPIRTPDGEMMPGVGSEDDGVKGGLNAVSYTHLDVYKRQGEDSAVDLFRGLLRHAEVDATGSYGVYGDARGSKLPGKPSCEAEQSSL